MISFEQILLESLSLDDYRLFQLHLYPAREGFYSVREWRKCEIPNYRLFKLRKLVNGYALLYEAGKLKILAE